MSGFGRVTYLRVNVGGPAEQNSEILSRADVYGRVSQTSLFADPF